MENGWLDHSIAVKNLEILVSHRTENEHQSGDPERTIDVHFYSTQVVCYQPSLVVAYE